MMVMMIRLAAFSLFLLMKYLMKCFPFLVVPTESKNFHVDHIVLNLCHVFNGVIVIKPFLDANQWTDFYMITASVMKGLRSYETFIFSKAVIILPRCLHCTMEIDTKCNKLFHTS